MSDSVQRINSTYPADNAFAITPDDEADLAVTTRGVHCNAAGDLVAVFAGDSEAVTLTLAAGITYPFRVKRVMEATDAEIVGLA